MTISTIEYSELDVSAKSTKTLLEPDDLSLISDIQVELDIVIGKKNISISELYALKRGEVLQLDSEIDSVVDVCLNGNVVARGNLVVVEDNYGIKITESLHA